MFPKYDREFMIAGKESRRRNICLTNIGNTNAKIETLMRFFVSQTGYNDGNRDDIRWIDKTANQCFVITLKLFYYLHERNIEAYYTFGWVGYNDNDCFRFDLNDFDNWLKNRTVINVPIHAHAWLTLSNGDIIDMTFLPTVETLENIKSIPPFIFNKPSILRKENLNHHPAILTTSPLDLLQKIGFSFLYDHTGKC